MGDKRRNRGLLVGLLLTLAALALLPEGPIKHFGINTYPVWDLVGRYYAEKVFFWYQAFELARGFL
jgi:hypothetical protein